MDWLKQPPNLKKLWEKYRWFLLVLVLGVGLMLLPDRVETVKTPVSETPRKEDLQTRLSQVLSRLEGAGETVVLLTEVTGEEPRYQADISDSGRQDTVLVTGSDRTQSGLVRRIDPPAYRGALILCQGGGDPAVRLAVTQAGAGITGLSADKITVLKLGN